MQTEISFTQQAVSLVGMLVLVTNNIAFPPSLLNYDFKVYIEWKCVYII